jgi:energy-coupling factor transporter transmembrane protein EcfT
MLWAIRQANPLASAAFGGEGGPQLINPRVVTVLIAAALAAFVGVASADTSLRSREHWHRNSAAVALLGIFPFILPAGTNQNLYRMLAVSSAILVALTLAVVATLKCWKLRLSFLTVLFASLVILTTIVVSDSHKHPFRSGPTNTQTSELCNVKRTSCFFVDDFRSQEFTGLLAAASDAGWAPMTPLFALATPWSATVAWIMSAEIPDSIMFTLTTGPSAEAHGAADAVFRHNLEKIDAHEWRNGWILVTSESPPGEGRTADRWNMDRDSSMRRARLAANAVGKSFPRDYRLIWVASDPSAVAYGERVGIELWAPR